MPSLLTKYRKKRESHQKTEDTGSPSGRSVSGTDASPKGQGSNPSTATDGHHLNSPFSGSSGDGSASSRSFSGPTGAAGSHPPVSVSQVPRNSGPSGQSSLSSLGTPPASYAQSFQQQQYQGSGHGTPPQAANHGGHGMRGHGPVPPPQGPPAQPQLQPHPQHQLRAHPQAPQGLPQQGQRQGPPPGHYPPGHPHGPQSQGHPQGNMQRQSHPQGQVYPGKGQYAPSQGHGPAPGPAPGPMLGPGAGPGAGPAVGPAVGPSSSPMNGSTSPHSNVDRLREHDRHFQQRYRQPHSEAPATYFEPPASDTPWAEWNIRRACPSARFGHSANYVAARDGELFIMGGIRDMDILSDLWVIDTNMLTGYQLVTEGAKVGPRVGHASLVLGNAHVVFGGDTKVEETDPLDDNLYLLNTSSLKWTVAQPTGPRPCGRYGHSLSNVASRIYVFGGQVDDKFYDDMWMFELTQWRSPSARWELVKPRTPPPPPRTNHTIITWHDKLYLFGGANGDLWYSDTWCFDPVTLEWTQLDCSGYVPAPCQGHAATIIGDVMYVFGGMSSQGNLIDQLFALKLPTLKWYTFQNLGPGPSHRSGHSLTAFDNDKILVWGGTDQSNTAFILDVSRINYPDDAADEGRDAPAVAPPEAPTPAARNSVIYKRGSMIDVPGGPVSPMKARQAASYVSEGESADEQYASAMDLPTMNAQARDIQGSADASRAPAFAEPTAETPSQDKRDSVDTLKASSAGAQEGDSSVRSIDQTPLTGAPAQKQPLKGPLGSQRQDETFQEMQNELDMPGGLGSPSTAHTNPPNDVNRDLNGDLNGNLGSGPNSDLNDGLNGTDLNQNLTDQGLNGTQTEDLNGSDLNRDLSGDDFDSGLNGTEKRALPRSQPQTNLATYQADDQDTPQTDNGQSQGLQAPFQGIPQTYEDGDKDLNASGNASTGDVDTKISTQNTSAPYPTSEVAVGAGAAGVAGATVAGAMGHLHQAGNQAGQLGNQIAGHSDQLGKLGGQTGDLSNKAGQLGDQASHLDSQASNIGDQANQLGNKASSQLGGQLGGQPGQVAEQISHHTGGKAPNPSNIAQQAYDEAGNKLTTQHDLQSEIPAGIPGADKAASSIKSPIQSHENTTAPNVKGSNVPETWGFDPSQKSSDVSDASDASAPQAWSVDPRQISDKSTDALSSRKQLDPSNSPQAWAADNTRKLQPSQDRSPQAWSADNTRMLPESLNSPSVKLPEPATKTVSDDSKVVPSSVAGAGTAHASANDSLHEPLKTPEASEPLQSSKDISGEPLAQPQRIPSATAESPSGTSSPTSRPPTPSAKELGTGATTLGTGRAAQLELERLRQRDKQISGQMEGHIQALASTRQATEDALQRAQQREDELARAQAEMAELKRQAASAKTAQEHAETQLSQLQEAHNELRTAHEKALAEPHGSGAGGVGAGAVLGTSIGQLVSQWSTFNQQHREIESAHSELAQVEKELADLRQKHAQAPSSSDLDALRTQLGSEHSKHIADIQEQHSTAVTSLQGEHSRALDSLRTGHSTAIDSLRDDHSRQLSGLEQRLKTLEAQHSELQTEYSKALELSKNQQEALTRTREELGHARAGSQRLEEQLQEARMLADRGDPDESAASMGSTSGGQASLVVRDLRAQVIILEEEREELRQQVMQLKKAAITSRNISE